MERKSVQLVREKDGLFPVKNEAKMGGHKNVRNFTVAADGRV